VKELAFLDGLLTIGTAVDNSGFEKGTSNLKSIANTALGQLTADVVQKVSSAAAQIPQQMVTVGSGFEASMSQVAATMGITSAAAEFQTLSAAAKEMGESTKFSASQAGEALNYLALAGYDANKAVAALPTVLNVAAAGGMELAAASDMVTDAMSALGLETSQMADFSDKLAVTAQKSNTSVSQLGEAILTVGGTAKMLSGGVTEMNTALGILADNGIKGSEGGTALRNVILSLSAPTDTAAAALESLGVTAFDASGAMRPLEDTFADLNTALSSLSDQERTAVLNEIFNKVDLKSVNALLGTSSERFDELSGYISDCAGAAAQMAETMDDNLNGDLTIMQSALEGLGIAAYEKFQVPFRDAVQEVSTSIGELTKSLSNGELSASVDKVSNGFSKIASAASEFALNKAIPAVLNTFEWIIDNEHVLSGALTAIVSGFIAFKAITVLPAIITSVTTALAALNPTIIAISAAFAGTMAIMEMYTKHQNEIRAAAMQSAAVYRIEVDRIDELTASYHNVVEEADKLVSVQDKENNRLNALKAALAEQVDENGNVVGSMELVKDIISEINEIYPEHIELINGQINGYRELRASIDDFIEKTREEALIESKRQKWSEAITIYGDLTVKDEELYNTWQETEAEYKDALARYDRFRSGPGNYTITQKEEAQAMGVSMKTYFENQYESAKEAWETAGEAYLKNRALMWETEDDIRKYTEALDNASSKNIAVSFNDSESQINKMGARYAAEYTSAYEKSKQAIADGGNYLANQQEETTSALESAWKQAEHAYATGVITTEAELYRQKSALLEQYGNADLEDHWKYYEDLYAYQKESAENSIRLAEEAAREQADIRDQEWNNIAHRQSLGLLSAEDAYRQQLAFIKKYCPEYSDEWYSYYQTILEYQRDAQQKQVDSVKDGISELVSEYKSAFKELESERNSYKNRLMSAGSLFSVDTETDENGNTSKIVSVENMRKQMAEMQKYHDYVAKLKSRGASRELIGELTSMDFEDGSFTAKNLAQMSTAEFDEINELYRKKEELADKLSGELFEPELNELNEGLVNGVLDKFGTLPPEIQEIGAESLAAFIAGLTGGDLSEQVDEFAEKFASDCAEGIQSSFAGIELDYAALMNADAYSIGKNAGDEYVEGFNEALAQIQTAIAAEQNFSAASTAPKRYSETVPQTSAESSARGNSSDRIVIRNHIKVDMDGEKVAEKVIEKEEIINYRKGE